MGLRSARCAPSSSRCAATSVVLTKASVAIDGSKFKAVNNRDRNFTRAKVERRRAQLEASVARYLSQLDTAVPGAVGGACGQDGTPQGEARQARKRDAAPRGDGEADVGFSR